ncbi:hypothetical protein [Aeromicrobium massiliense]|uniref:hypothetical protein n=1 Tax=Aeromicrobium massiliense TaxID=1464554 RepID=UPI00067401A2|nr:hypothetical protein [Aeromicrobium massiliense]
MLDWRAPILATGHDSGMTHAELARRTLGAAGVELRTPDLDVLAAALFTDADLVGDWSELEAQLNALSTPVEDVPADDTASSKETPARKPARRRAPAKRRLSDYKPL